MSIMDRTYFLSIDATTILKLTGLSVSGSVTEATGAITNETTGLFPETEASGMSVTLTGNFVTTPAICDAMWAKKWAGVQIPYVAKRSTGAGKTQWAGNCTITSMSENNIATGQATGSITIKLSGQPTVTPQLVLTPAAGALAAQVGVSATSATFQATGGAAAYVYTAVGIPPGMAINSGSGVFNGTPIAGSQGTHIMEVTATDDNDVALTQRYTVVVAAA
jgi:hypothetical protein